MGIITDSGLNFSLIYQLIISSIDIIVVAIIFYGILLIVKNNAKTLRIFKGTIIVLIVDFIAKLLQLKTLEIITQNLINWGFLVFIIIFQPEIRVFLERIGKSGLVDTSLAKLGLNEYIIDELDDAVQFLSTNKVGGLIAIEREMSLQDYIDKGVALNSDITTELLETLFNTNTPLHDGAIIIQGSKIACASTFFPPTTREVKQSYGARHRAAIGISEICDALIIVVSEETGFISIVEYGDVRRVTRDSFSDKLVNYLAPDSQKDDELGVDK